MSTESELSKAQKEMIALYSSRLNGCHYCVDSNPSVASLETGNFSEDDTDAMRSAGWSDQTIEDTICVVSTFAFLNRLVDGFGVGGFDDHIEQVGGMVAGQGYQPLVKMIQQKTGVAS